MKTLLCEYRRAKSAAIAAMFFAAIASTSTVRGQYTYITSFGSYGSGAGQFQYPQGLAAGPTGQIYVADTGNNRIDVFTSTGAIGNPASFGSYGSSAGQVANPFGVAVGAEGQVYVADDGNGRIDVFTSTGGTGNPASFGSYGSGPGQVEYPIGVAVGPAGQVYVAENGNSRIDVFTSTGGNATPASFGSYGSGPGQFSDLFGVAVGPAEQIYVADNGNNRIDVFTSTGGTGNPASFSTLSQPVGVAVGPGTGNVYVADPGNNTIDVYNSSGQYLTYFGSSGTGNGQFNYPYGAAVSPTGEIYVIDGGNSRIEKFFDLAEWVSGSPHFSTAAVGPGQILGSNLSMSNNQGLLVDGGLTINAGGALTQSGTVSAGAVTNNGVYTIAGTSLTIFEVNDLQNNTTLTITNGGSVAGWVVNWYGATLNTNGATITSELFNEALSNYGTLLQSGQLTISGNFFNYGNATLSGQLSISGSLDNEGLVLINPGAAVTGGVFQNTSTGILRGDGSVTSALTNSGLIDASGGMGLTLSNFSGGNLSGAELRVEDGDSLQIGPAFSNQGLINLKGPGSVLSGGSIANAGIIQGQGSIFNPVQNSGTITPLGGQLVLEGGGNSNAAGAIIEVAAGTSILFTQGLGVNQGSIDIAGGGFSNGSSTLANSGSILGNGSFSSGSLANFGTVTFSDGNTSIFGPMSNAAGASIETYGTSATIITFYGAVTNSASSAGHPAGYIKIDGATTRWLGGLTNNGTYISDPAANYFTGLAVGPTGLLQGGAGDQFFVTGPFTNAGRIDLGGTSQMFVNYGFGTLTQTAGKLEIGGAPSGSAALSAGAVDIEGGTLLADGPDGAITANLVYESSSSSTYQGILAGAGNSLLVDNPLATLVLTGTGNTYGGGTFVENGTLIVINNEGLADGSSLTVGDPTLFGGVVPGSAAADVRAVPEPSALALAAAGAIVLIALRAKRPAVEY